MKKWLSLCILGFLALGCAQRQPFTHDEDAAIAAGNAFFKALMDKNFQTAYEQYLSPGIKFGPQGSLEQFTADMQAVTDQFGPIEKAVFDAYQLVPGRKVIQLYYTVKHAKAGDVVYHLVTEAVNPENYTIFLIDIGNQAKYPENATTEEPKQKKAETIEVVP